MKYFLLLVLVVLGLKHVTSDSKDAVSDASLPSWFTPDDWSADKKEDVRGQLEKALAEVDDYIANPPTRR